MTDPKRPAGRPSRAPQHIGGNSRAGIDDLPPEQRQRLEQALRQMRDSGALADRNHDGIPDHLEIPLRVIGWVGRLTGNPRLKERLLQQMKDFGVTPGAVDSAASVDTRRSSSARVAPTSSRPTPPVASRAGSKPRPARQQSSAPAPAYSVVQRSSRDTHTDTSLGAFLRKLVIVSGLVTAGYLVWRMLSGG